MEEYDEWLFRFVIDPEVEPTNNRAAGALSTLRPRRHHSSAGRPFPTIWGCMKWKKKEAQNSTISFEYLKGHVATSSLL